MVDSSRSHVDPHIVIFVHLLFCTTTSIETRAAETDITIIDISVDDQCAIIFIVYVV